MPVRILVCVNRRLGSVRPSCAEGGGEALLGLIDAALRARGLAIQVERFICFGACDEGPNVRIAPGGRFFHRVGAGDVDAIVAEAERVAAG